MANVSSPLGFKPAGKADGTPYSGAVTPYKIAAAYGTGIYLGDVVKLITTGYINLAAAGDQMRGVFAGCTFIDATGTPKRLPYWPASQTTLGSQDAVALIIDDPKVLFEAQINAAATQAAVGANFNLVAGTGSTATGLSAEQIDFASLTTSAAQFGFVRFVDRVDNDPTTAYARGLFIPKSHDYNVTTGI